MVPGFNVQQGECNASIVGSTEGALYNNRLTEDSVLWYWRKSLCRQVPLYFEKKVEKDPFHAYKFILRENVYDRFENENEDCYKGSFQRLPDGLSDVSKCFYGNFDFIYSIFIVHSFIFCLFPSSSFHLSLSLSLLPQEHFKFSLFRRLSDISIETNLFLFFSFSIFRYANCSIKSTFLWSLSKFNDRKTGWFKTDSG